MNVLNTIMQPLLGVFMLGFELGLVSHIALILIFLDVWESES